MKIFQLVNATAITLRATCVTPWQDNACKRDRLNNNQQVFHYYVSSRCKPQYGGRACDECNDGHYMYPTCASKYNINYRSEQVPSEPHEKATAPTCVDTIWLFLLFRRQDKKYYWHCSTKNKGPTGNFGPSTSKRPAKWMQIIYCDTCKEPIFKKSLWMQYYHEKLESSRVNGNILFRKAGLYGSKYLV